MVRQGSATDPMPAPLVDELQNARGENQSGMENLPGMRFAILAERAPSERLTTRRAWHVARPSARSPGRHRDQPFDPDQAEPGGEDLPKNQRLFPELCRTEAPPTHRSSQNGAAGSLSFQDAEPKSQ